MLIERERCCFYGSTNSSADGFADKERQRFACRIGLGWTGRDNKNVLGSSKALFLVQFWQGCEN
jgi:hypothetical protein